MSRPEAEAYRARSGMDFDYEKLGRVIGTVIDEKLSTLQVNMDGRRVGQIVAGTVSREIAMEARALRYVNI